MSAPRLAGLVRPEKRVSMDRIIPLVLLLGALAPAQAPPPLSDDERILHALERLTFGPRPGQVDEVKAVGLAKWIEAQLHPEGIDDGAVRERLRAFPTLGLPAKEQQHLYQTRREALRGKPADPEAMRRLIRRELRETVALRACLSERQLHEVLSDFWRNHFNVDANKDSVQATATHFEEAVVRAHALGKFQDLLFASARHPAMLVYLDNALSRRPPAKSELYQIERRLRKETGSRERALEQVEFAKQAGLNENYARELMELHTLGVDNGYTQQDVTEVARAFTGWTVDLGPDGSGFLFKDDMHDTGAKTVLGMPLPEGRREEGIVEGETVLRRLAAHPNTARFVATKLCRRLVADEPPEEVVEHATRAFRQTKGDLREVVRAIVTHPQWFDRRHFRAKFKTPLEFVVSALRATGAVIDDAGPIVHAVSELGMPIYGCEDPTGWSDAAEAWGDPGVMVLRWRYAMALAHAPAPGPHIPASFFADLPEDPTAIASALERRIVPSGVGPATAGVVRRIVGREVEAGRAADPAGRTAMARTLVGVLLGSPEFQQQ
jgi:uncharacterized protein (DUF1800 family)